MAEEGFKRKLTAKRWNLMFVSQAKRTRLIIVKKETNVKSKPFHLLINIFHYIFLPVFISLILNVNALADKREVRVGVYANKPLVYQDENGEHKGLSIDVLRFVASKENWKLEFVPCSWSECLEMVKRGENDIQVIIAKTPERAKIYDFTSQSLYSLWAQIFIHPDSDIGSWTDLQGKNVAVYKDDLFSETFKKLIMEFGIDCNLLEVESYQSMLKLMKEKKADAGVFIQTFAEPYAIRGIVRRTPIMFNPVPIYYAFPKGKVPELVTAIDRHFKTLKKDKDSIYYQSLDKIFVKERELTIPLWIKWILIVAPSLMFLSLIGSTILRRQVKARTAELLLKNTKLEEEISERERVEETLRESEERLAAFMESATDGFILFDSELNHIEMNKIALKITGFERKDVIGKNVIDTVPNIKESGRYDEYKKVMKTGVSFIIPDMTFHPLAGDKHIELKAFKVGEGLGIIFTDITERKQAEEALRESEEKFRLLTEQNLIGVIIIQDGFVKYVNNAASELTEYSIEEAFDWKPNEFGKLFHPDNLKFVMEQAQKKQEGAKDVVTHYSYRLITKSGKIKWVDQYSKTINFKGKTADLITIIDITDRKQAENALRESEERYRALFEDNPVETIVVDKDSRITMYNKAKRTSGDRQPSIGDVMYKDYAASHLINMHQELVECIQQRKSKDFPDQNYRSKFLDIRMFPLEEGAIITSIDRTEKKNLEAKLRRTQKMESLGLMAGGIAHDLNNILSGIVSYPELLLMDLSEDSPLRKPIKTIKDSGMRAADVVSDLLTVARGVATGKEVLNLNTMIEECLSSAEHQELKTRHSLITFKTDLDSDLLNISCSSSHIKKSLTNLITNASEAIEGSGTVTISTMNRYLDEPLKAYEDVRKGEYAVLTVSDDGSGISANDLERIFEPFYTKKVMGRSGTGLGLAVVWNTIQDHDGYINVKTGKKGTAFELYFPVSRNEVAIEGDAVPVKDYLGHGERVLAVDDENRQREIACGILTKLGYDAEAVSSGEEAVEYLEEQSVDLIVLDMIMPKGMNGRETYEKIIEIHPGQKAIIASGYAETPDVKKAQKLGAGKYIKKPYTMGKIGLAVKEELEK